MYPYLQIARPDHWFKNVFMLLGVIFAIFYAPEVFQSPSALEEVLIRLVVALVAVCLIVSSNYVLNEILDAPTDRSHPSKSARPIPSGKVFLPAAYAEWVILGILGLCVAWPLGKAFFGSALALLIMGVLYNVPPIRTKDWIYLDVLSESINNPLRLLLGWFVVLHNEIPPLSLLISYWMIGAFFMATKRYAEYRWINDPERAGRYRRSFQFYTENKLLVSMFIYSVASALFLGVFIVRYRLELILSFPLLAGFFGYYLWIGLKPNSVVQNPEHLYRERGLMLYLLVCMGVFFLLMFVDIPFLYEWFNVRSSEIAPLWIFY